MRTAQPLREALPPGYSGPTPRPPQPPQRPERAPPGEPEVLEDIPFELGGPQNPAPQIRHQSVQPSPHQPAQQPAQPPHAAPSEAADSGASKIRMFDQKLGAGRHEDSWKRTPNINGTGAIHVKSFHCKLTGDSLDFLDQQINEWLDAHPQYEVKMVTTSIGEWTGKLKEPNLIVNVWV